ncbi:MAG: cupredoxin domain-containing protein [bacterium]|nr:cupredoxin domain-containing protein [bacterium]
MNKTFAAVICTLVIFLLGGMYIASRQSTPPPAVEPQTQGSTESGGAVEGDDDIVREGEQEVEEVVIEASEFAYDVTRLDVNNGKKIRLILKNVGKMPHDFVIDELNVRTKVLKSGETDTIEFTPATAGTFEFYCSIGSHRQMGMKGTIIVR